MRSPLRVSIVVLASDPGHDSAAGGIMAVIPELRGLQLTGIAIVGRIAPSDTQAISNRVNCPVEQLDGDFATALTQGMRFAASRGSEAVLFLDAAIEPEPDAIMKLVQGYCGDGKMAVVGGLIDRRTQAGADRWAGHAWVPRELGWRPSTWLEWGRASIELEPIDCPNPQAMLVSVAVFDRMGKLDARLPPGMAFAHWCQRARHAGYPAYVCLAACFRDSGAWTCVGPENDPYAVAVSRLAWASQEGVGRWARRLKMLGFMLRDLLGPVAFPWSQLRGQSPRGLYWLLSGYLRRIHSRFTDADNHARLRAARDFLGFTGRR